MSKDISIWAMSWVSIVGGGWWWISCSVVGHGEYILGGGGWWWSFQEEVSI